MQIISVMDMVLILIQMEPNIKENGKMIFNMERVWKNGLMEADMKECILKEKNKEKVHNLFLVFKVFIYGVTDLSTQEIGLIIRSMEKY